MPAIAAAQADEDAVVQAVLFYSPTCPHCHKVINEVIIPMTEEYENQLQVLGIDTTNAEGSQLYQVAIERFNIPDERRGVPTLIIGEVVLVGSGEIPAQFPDLVKEHLAAGGLGWPDIPGLVEAITAGEAQQEAASQQEAESQAGETQEGTSSPIPTPTLAPQATPLPTDTPSPVTEQSVLTIDKNNTPPVAETEIPPSDPVGMFLAAVILIGMLAAFGYTLWRLVTAQPGLFQLAGPAVHVKTWAIPVISLLGLGVAIYLTYVEINQVTAVCGPVGECNIVQASPYARLLDVPVAVWGLLSYVTIIILWAIQRFTTGSLAKLSVLTLVGLVIWGTIFSIYLTWLEIFTIHAVCIWCLSSAIISALLILVSAKNL